MPGNEMAVIKPEALKSYIWLQTADGSLQQVDEEVAMFCPMIYREILKTGMGSSKNYAISLPEKVNPVILSSILDYCRFHQVPGRSNKERKAFDEKFIRTDVNHLCELTSAADSLQLRPLVDLTCRALARMMEGKTPEEIRETFHIPDDLTEEEKLEPIKNITDDPRIRLLNRLYAKKRKELKERQRLKDMEGQDAKKERDDERSVEDLLSFINGKDGDAKFVRSAKHKKKNRRRHDQSKVSKNDPSKEAAKHSMMYQKTIDTSFQRTSSDMGRNIKDVFGTMFDENDNIDDDLDPALKEELDREVEDFARRLNSDWLSVGQERRLLPSTVNGNGSLRIYSGIDWR